MKYTWLVEKYLDGELKGEELRNFEMEILKNPETAEEVERIRQLDAFARKNFAAMGNHDLVEDYFDIQNIVDQAEIRNDLESLKIRKISENDPGLQDFRGKVKNASSRMTAKINIPHKAMISRHIVWIAAASVALLIAITLLTVFTTRQKTDLQAVYTEFYEPYRPDIITRDLNSPGSGLFRQGLQEYYNANYNKALNYFIQVVPGTDANNSLYLFGGICYMELEKYDLAVSSFNSIINDPVLHEYGQWYKGLCYLKLEQPVEAREEFKKISDQGGYFKDKAKAILKRL